MRQLELTERIMRLRTVPVFAGVSTADLAQLAASVRARALQKGEVLLHEDAAPRSFFLLTVGSVTMRRKGKHIGTVRAPGGVGFLSVLARTAGATEAVAETYTEGYEVPADAMDEVLEDHFSVYLATLRWVADRLIAENRDAPPPPYVAPVVPYDHLIGDRELGIVERIFILRRTRGLASANVNSIARLARQMREVRAPRGTVFWRPGDSPDESVLVVKGMLDLSWNDGASVQKVGPGYIVGGAESLVGHVRWNQLTARDDVLVLLGPRNAFLDMLEDDHAAAMQMLSLLAQFLMAIWDRKAEAGIASVGSAPPKDEETPAAERADTNALPRAP